MKLSERKKRNIQVTEQTFLIPCVLIIVWLVIRLMLISVILLSYHLQSTAWTAVAASVCMFCVQCWLAFYVLPIRELCGQASECREEAAAEPNQHFKTNLSDWIKNNGINILSISHLIRFLILKNNNNKTSESLVLHLLHLSLTLWSKTLKKFKLALLEWQRQQSHPGFSEKHISESSLTSFMTKEVTSVVNRKQARQMC